jgi:2-phosphosulfolactate phosphatase
MVIDTGMGLRATQDLVGTAAFYVDIIKSAWGTSRLLSESVVREKINLLRAADVDVSLGGTFLEIAFDQERVDEYLQHARTIGISTIEVSNGIHPTMQAQDKEWIIRRAADMGFRVLSEVGRKLASEDELLSVRDRIGEAERDLAAGADKVIFEAREAGTVGIFTPTGEVKKEMAYQLFQEIDTTRIIWEAPKKPQQVWLIRNLGPNANLGNIAPTDLLSVESLRLGLRADTMRDHRKGVFSVYLDVGVGGALRAKDRADIVVVVDALRASTTIIQALELGARCVRPVVSADDCVGDVTAGERGGTKLPHTDFSNSPTELIPETLRDQELVLTTTNGTECIKAAKGEDNPVLIGSLTNATAVSRLLLDLVRRTGRNVTLLAAGRNNLPAIEDVISVTEIKQRLNSCVHRGILELRQSDSFEGDFLNSDSGRNLVKLGYARDVLFCAQLDRFDIVPAFDGERITILQEDAKTLADRGPVES